MVNAVAEETKNFVDEHGNTIVDPGAVENAKAHVELGKEVLKQAGPPGAGLLLNQIPTDLTADQVIDQLTRVEVGSV